MPEMPVAGTPVRVLGVGAGAPALRLDARDIGAAWGRGGRGQIAACAPDEDTLTLAWDAASAALAAAGVEADAVDAIYWGTSRPPFAEGPEPRVPRGGPRPADAPSAARCSPVRPTRAWRRSRRAPTPLARARRASRSSWSSDALPPGPRHRFRSALRRGRGRGRARRERRCGVDRAAGHALTAARRPLPRRRRDRQPRSLRRPAVPRRDLPAEHRSGAARAWRRSTVGAWSLPDPDGRLGAVIAKRVGADPRRVGRGVRERRRHRCGRGTARCARRARRGRARSRSSAPAAAARRACS